MRSTPTNPTRTKTRPASEAPASSPALNATCTAARDSQRKYAAQEVRAPTCSSYSRTIRSHYDSLHYPLITAAHASPMLSIGLTIRLTIDCSLLGRCSLITASPALTIGSLSCRFVVPGDEPVRDQSRYILQRAHVLCSRHTPRDPPTEHVIAPPEHVIEPQRDITPAEDAAQFIKDPFATQERLDWQLAQEKVNDMVYMLREKDVAGLSSDFEREHFARRIMAAAGPEYAIHKLRRALQSTAAVDSPTLLSACMSGIPRLLPTHFPLTILLTIHSLTIRTGGIKRARKM